MLIHWTIFLIYYCYYVIYIIKCPINYLFFLVRNVQFTPKMPYLASIQVIVDTIQLRYVEVCRLNTFQYFSN